jgi:hypothetical protein
MLMLLAVCMGFRQGWAMLSNKPEMAIMFSKWDVNKEGITVFGAITILSALLIFFPKTFILGNFVMATTILLIICLQLSTKDIKNAVIELPFFLLNLLIIYLQYPLPKQK